MHCYRNKQILQIETMFLNCLAFFRCKHTSSSQRQYPTVIQELCHQFSLSDLRKSTNNFDQHRVIGCGTFGKVYKGFLQQNDASDDHTVALKQFNVKDSRGCEVFKNEIELLCQLRHPNIVPLIGFCNHQKEKIIVYKYMSNGSLAQHLQHMELSWKKRLEICIGVARGLHYLHSGAKRSIYHCDLKPSNILMDGDMEPKLAGFGLSIQGAHFMSKPKPINVDRSAGSIWVYMAMEYIMDNAITDKCDVFSFGIVLFEVVCGRKHYNLLMPAEAEILKKPVEETIDPNIKGKIAPECWQVFKDVMVNCLKYEADERPTMGEVEVLLVHALSLQEHADITNTNCGYALLSRTIIPLGVKQ